MQFNIFGHENVLCTHPTTLEFTKDNFLTTRGDCIVGVSADFKIEKEIFSAKKIRITIRCCDFEDFIIADVNPKFSSSHEIVIRKTDFLSDRTLGIHASKSSLEIDRRIVECLKNKDVKAEVIIEVVK